jgi:hypothetical protein
MWPTSVQWSSISQLPLRTALTLNGLGVLAVHFTNEYIVSGIVTGLARIEIPWWCKPASRLMTEAARQRARKKKMKFLAHQ